jgi:hypothetical protein
MRTRIRRSRRSARALRSLGALSALLALAACGPHYHLDEYDFSNHSVALVYLAPATPVLRTGAYDAADAGNVAQAVLRTGSGVAREIEGRRARARLDSALRHVDVATMLSQRTLDRASRYLGARPVQRRDGADFLLEVDMHSFGIDARDESAAYLFMNATAVLLDARTGRELWSHDLQGYDRITPYVRGTEQLPTGIITAGALGQVSVPEFQRVLAQLADYSSDRITDELRAALRDAREH